MIKQTFSSKTGSLFKAPIRAVSSAAENTADKEMRSKLIFRGNELLTEACKRRVTDFPVGDEVLTAIEACSDALRNLDGFWEGKGMSIAATQVGMPQMPLFVMCKRQNWYKPTMYKNF
jgi:peptide deformylase